MRLLFIILSFLLLSCSVEKQEDDSLTKRKIKFSNDANFNGYKYSELVDTVFYVPLETTLESHIGQIDKILVTERWILVLDILSAKSIFKFSRNGEFSSKIGNVGKGPGEYTMPLDITVKGDSLFIVDGGAKKILIYDLNSDSHIRDQNLDFFAQKIATWEKGFIIVEGQRGHKALITDNNFKLIKKQFPFNFVNGRDVQLPFNVDNEDNLLYRTFLSDTIWKFSGDVFQPYLILDLGSNSIDRSIFKSLAENKKQVRNSEISDYRANIKYFGVTENNIYLNYLYQNSIFTGIYDIKDETSRLFEFNKVINDVTFEDYIPLIIGNHDNYFVGHTFGSPKDSISGKYAPSFREAQTKYGDAIMKDQNPTLFFIRFD